MDNEDLVQQAASCFKRVLDGTVNLKEANKKTQQISKELKLLNKSLKNYNSALK